MPLLILNIFRIDFGKRRNYQDSSNIVVNQEFKGKVLHRCAWTGTATPQQFKGQIIELEIFAWSSENEAIIQLIFFAFTRDSFVKLFPEINHFRMRWQDVQRGFLCKDWFVLKKQKSDFQYYANYIWGNKRVKKSDLFKRIIYFTFFLELRNNIFSGEIRFLGMRNTFSKCGNIVLQ